MGSQRRSKRCKDLIFILSLLNCIDTVTKKTSGTTTTTTTNTPPSTTTASSTNTPTKDWSVEEVALLIKAANKFPGGVSDRWETIAAYVALHTGLPQRDADDVIKKSKAVQKGSHQEATVRQLQFQKKTYDIAEAPTVRYDIDDEVPPVAAGAGDAASAKKTKKKVPAAGTTPAKVNASPAPKAATPTAPVTATTTPAPTPAAGTPVAASTTTPPTSSGAGAKTAALAALTSPTAAAAPAAAPAASLWTAAEQKLLEAGMKAYPPSWQGEGDRWDKIAESVPGRSKKECKLRVKVSIDQRYAFFCPHAVC